MDAFVAGLPLLGELRGRDRCWLWPRTLDDLAALCVCLRVLPSCELLDLTSSAGAPRYFDKLC